MELLTPRLRLTSLSSSDFEEVAAMYADPEVMRGSSGVAAPRTRDESMQWLNRTLATTSLDAGRETFRVGDRATGTFLGRVGLRPDAHAPDTELAYAFVRSAWGRGIATEAAKAILAWGSTRGVTRIVARALAANVASQRVLVNAGMRRVGEEPTPDGELLLYESVLAGR